MDPRTIEIRARELAGGVHARGAIPAQFWRQAIQEILGPPQARSEAERTNRIMRDVLRGHVAKLEAEARQNGWD